MDSHTHTAMRATLAVVALTVFPGPVVGQQLTYSGSLSMASGDYLFTQRTRSLYFSNGLSAEAGRFTLSGSIPVVLQDSPWISYSIAGTIPTGGTDEAVVVRRRGGGESPGTGGGGQHQKTAVSPIATAVDDPSVPVDTVSYAQIGVGDPGLRLDVRVLQPSGSRPSLSLSASCKPPLADVDQGFGTGSWDAGLGVSTVARFGRMFVFAGGERWWFGDMPELPLNNAWSYNVAVGVALAPGRLAMMASYSGFTSIIDSVDPPRQLGLGVSLTPGSGYSVSLSSSVGLTEGASDFSVGIGWRVEI